MRRSGTHTHIYIAPSTAARLQHTIIQHILKQVDMDGRFTYSNITKVMFESFGDAVNIYPNPAKNYIQFDYVSKQKTILVNLFDVQGRLINTTTLANVQPLKLNIETVAKGKYIFQLSDGEKIASGSFIKQ